MHEHNPDHYAFRRESGLRAHDFRDERSRMTAREGILVAVVMSLITAIVALTVVLVMP